MKTVKDDLTPPPPRPIAALIERRTLPVGAIFHRVHQNIYHATQFNPGPRGNARFSPISDSAGAQIPTLYAGDSLHCALMETVFHDVPFHPGNKPFDKAKLQNQHASQFFLTQKICVASLTSTALRKLGVQRKLLVDTEKSSYPSTRLWAEAIHAECPDIQGLSWMSRQDDTALALVLFGDRIKAGAIHPRGASRDLIGHSATYKSILDLANRIGVLIFDAST
ncbi:hypothetical protein LMG31884_25480 [Xanthomonas hydrangeae]|uniref:RES family NAD+ phosphorylase n=1 Tax=Xanthomonas hydrangeae TaxID=2775159 RepID=UPI0019638A30|nr:hypothetical protein LMG31884_25480 [Xanthomonas hydrangeae]CAD7717318.1 hypothetical protein LMG31884_25480 [Xanthomonas hydrangeae]CAD7733859.1 hypothetical protein LMG31887_25360 [Xanthomonas hydrangeae]CAD7733862.1 hypothetical protein LMG31887_25360 [Xanthomonas hydrangeae]